MMKNMIFIPTSCFGYRVKTRMGRANEKHELNDARCGLRLREKEKKIVSEKMRELTQERRRGAERKYERDEEKKRENFFWIPSAHAEADRFYLATTSVVDSSMKIDLYAGGGVTLLNPSRLSVSIEWYSLSSVSLTLSISGATASATVAAVVGCSDLRARSGVVDDDDDGPGRNDGSRFLNSLWIRRAVGEFSTETRCDDERFSAAAAVSIGRLECGRSLLLSWLQLLASECTVIVGRFV